MVSSEDGKSVARQRKLNGWTQPELADRAKVSTSTVAKLEAGTPAALKSVAKVMRALGWEPERFPSLIREDRDQRQAPEILADLMRNKFVTPEVAAKHGVPLEVTKTLLAGGKAPRPDVRKLLRILKESPDADWAEDLIEGIGGPADVAIKELPTGAADVELSGETLAMVQKMAADDGLSVQDFMKRLLREEFARLNAAKGGAKKGKK